MNGYRTFHAPGRVNIIGEHIDYNGGYVLPCSLNIGTTARIRKRDGKIISLSSANFDGTAEFTEIKRTNDWYDYPLGIVNFLCPDLSGFEIHFEGNIPNGAGLSSSASVSLATAVALNTVFELNYSMLELVKLAQKAENEFCGVNCGIMDQFAIGMGKKNHAVYLNCGTLDYEHVPLDLGEIKILIMDTKKRRQLNESKYNERRAECEEALAVLSQTLNCQTLADISPEIFDANKHLIKNQTTRNRAEHVIFENHRVKQAVEFLQNGNTAALGKLLTQSHISLRDKYEVSCRELDTISEAANTHPACIGARMTGAGFGGCAIALVHTAEADDFIQTVTGTYTAAIGYAPQIYVCESGDGAREIL